MNIISAGVSSGSNQGLVVESPCGSIKGIVLKSRDGRDFYEWRGIPYAKAPVGPLRFASPQPFGKWEGVRDGSKFGARCPENSPAFGGIVGDEDCLNLNVSKPKMSDEKLLPVMVYIHGGAFQTGTACQYQPDYFMDEDVIYVNLNYRLGIFGFLNTGDTVIRGNMGLKDQVLALRWVKENIQSFGGDPNNITIFGESAGSTSVHHLVISSRTKGLFNKAISQSGVATNIRSCDPTAEAVEYTRKFAQRFNCDTEDSTKIGECLRSRSVAELLKAYSQEVGQGMVFRPDIRSRYYRPSIEAVDDEEALITEEPLKLLAEGKAQRIPWMVGNVSDEGLLSTIGFYASPEILKNFESNWECILWPFGLSKETPDAETLAAKIKDIYFPSNETFTHEQKLEQYTNLFSDASMHLNLSTCISLQREFSPVYPYYYSRKDGPSLAPVLEMLVGKSSMVMKILKFMATSLYNKVTGSKTKNYGVCHGDDLPMLFKMGMMFNIPKDPNSVDYRFSKDLVKLWVDFARDETSMVFRGESFPQLEPKSRLQYFEICETPKIIDEPFKERTDALKSLGLIEMRLSTPEE